jgi:hypothetical protein
MGNLVAKPLNDLSGHRELVISKTESYFCWQIQSFEQHKKTGRANTLVWIE